MALVFVYFLKAVFTHVINGRNWIIISFSVGIRLLFTWLVLSRGSKKAEGWRFSGFTSWRSLNLSNWSILALLVWSVECKTFEWIFTHIWFLLALTNVRLELRRCEYCVLETIISLLSIGVSNFRLQTHLSKNIYTTWLWFRCLLLNIAKTSKQRIDGCLYRLWLRRLI